MAPSPWYFIKFAHDIWNISISSAMCFVTNRISLELIRLIIANSLLSFKISCVYHRLRHLSFSHLEIYRAMKIHRAERGLSSCVQWYFASGSWNYESSMWNRIASIYPPSSFTFIELARRHLSRRYHCSSRHHEPHFTFSTASWNRRRNAVSSPDITSTSKVYLYCRKLTNDSQSIKYKPRLSEYYKTRDRRCFLEMIFHFIRHLLMKPAKPSIDIN